MLLGDARLRGQVGLKTGGSHSVFVTVTEVVPSTGTRFCRLAMASAYVRKG